MSTFTDHLYARQKLTDAVEVLAVGEEEVRSRLISSLTCLAPLREEQLPQASREEYVAIMRACTKSGALKDKEGRVVVSAVQHTLGGCRKRTAAQLAQRIFDLHIEVMRTFEDQAPNRVAGSD